MPLVLVTVEPLLHQQVHLAWKVCFLIPRALYWVRPLMHFLPLSTCTASLAGISGCLDFSDCIVIVWFGLFTCPVQFLETEGSGNVIIFCCFCFALSGWKHFLGTILHLYSKLYYICMTLILCQQLLVFISLITIDHETWNSVIFQFCNYSFYKENLLLMAACCLEVNSDTGR